MRAGEQRCTIEIAVGGFERRARAAARLGRIGGINARWSETPFPFDPLLLPVGFGPRFAACGLHPVVLRTGGSREKKSVNAWSNTVASSSVPLKMGRRAWRTACSSDESRPRAHAPRSPKLARADAKPPIAAQPRAERDQVLGQARKGVHQRRGAETEPNPKSVSSVYPPDSGVVGGFPRMVSSVA